MQSVAGKIDSAWDHKIELRLEKCLLLLTEVKRELQLPAGPFATEQLPHYLERPDSEQILDTLLLTSSVSRLLGNEAQADHLLRAIQDYFHSRNRQPSPRFFYEMGRTCFQRGDYSEALDYFLRVSVQASSELHQLRGLVNALFCLEVLGMPLDNTLREVNRRLENLRGRSTELARIESQLYAQQLRKEFHEGHLEKVLKTESGRRGDCLDQPRSFAYWLRLLPFHTGFRPLKDSELEQFQTTEPQIYYRQYRQHTIQGLLHPEELQNANLTELADRLYLWVWRWLCDPEAFPLVRILQLLRGLKLREKAHALTVEDRQLVRNALLWLGLFDPSCEMRLTDVLALLQNSSGADYSLLRFEYLVIHLLMAVRDKQTVLAGDLQRVLQEHPLWHSKELHFRPLLQALGLGGENGKARPLSAALEGLRTHLAPVLGQDAEASTKALVVDLAQNQLTLLATGKKIISPPLCLSLALFRSRATVSCEELLETSFGIRRYDPLIHNGKIFNLLARLKKLTDENLHFRMKNGHVLCQGSWDAIEVRKGHTAATRLRFAGEWQALLSTHSPLPAPSEMHETEREPSAPTGESLSLRQLAWRGSRTRRELEQHIGRSRSTTNRMLQTWLSQGLIRRAGRGRQTRYAVDSVRSRKEASL